MQAEGGVFAEQDNRAQHRDYGQTAIVAEVVASAPIAHRAFERFTDEGPLALLPQRDAQAGPAGIMRWSGACGRPAPNA